MMDAKVHEWDFSGRWYVGGVSFFAYQFALGFSLRWLTCLGGPMIRLYVGPVKFWITIS